MNKQHLPLVLVILDGWGIAKPSRGNAISLAKTPTMDFLFKKYPSTKLCAHGKCVGLPIKQDGNSEAGHMNLGAGRVTEQDAVTISQSINDGTFVKNPALLGAINHVNKNKGHLHLMGMISNGMSAHSDPDYIYALLSLCRQKKVKKIYIHLFTDGRDSAQFASLKLAEALMRELSDNELIATVMGRYYAMDRKKKWPNTEKAYNALVLGRGLTAASPQAAITESYNKKQTDEFIEPYIMQKDGKSLPRISDNDAVVFFNLRSDRARQLAKTFVQKDFNKMNPGSFKRKKVPKNLYFVAMTDFGPDLDHIVTAFPSRDWEQTLPMILRDHRQLYVSETEKYSHVTYFFNGGYAAPIAGEDRMMVDSPDVDNYAKTPKMSAPQVLREVLKSLKDDLHDFACVNFANPDMIAHTGNLEAGIKSVEYIDTVVKNLVEAILKKDGIAIITSDHGNVEEMINLETGEIDTEHSINPVPLMIVSNDKSIRIKRKSGVLGDVAPTILNLLNVKKPKEMSSRGLI